MTCDIIKDLLPLYIDDCCSADSADAVRAHLDACDDCRALHETMKGAAVEVPAEPITAPKKALAKIQYWKASLIQSLSLLAAFALITFGVAKEAATPSGWFNGWWAACVVVPSTGFLLSLINWYFVRLYRSRRLFSNCSWLLTLGITIGAMIWCAFHYELHLFQLLRSNGFFVLFELIPPLLYFGGVGIALTAILCLFSAALSDRYAHLLGKE